MDGLMVLLEMKQPTRIRPLAPVHAEWEYESSTYPDFVKLTMENGKTVVYRREIPQPGFVNAMEILDRIDGYRFDGGYTGKHEKSRSL